MRITTLLCAIIIGGGLTHVFWITLTSTPVVYPVATGRVDLEETSGKKLISSTTIDNRTPATRIDFEQLLDQAIKNQSGHVLLRLSEAVKHAWQLKNFSDDRQLLSRRLNTLFKELNQLICDLTDKETATGGWCINDFKRGHVTDVKLAEMIAKVLANQMVASFGDGPGQYRSIILGSGLVKTYDAYDGSPMIEQVTNGNVSYLDLSIPQYGLPLYDWVVSLEVVEHIPREYEDIFLSNVVRHAKRGLIFSWAKSGQGGLGHVNERPDAHVEAKMKALCFDRDQNQSTILREVATFGWLKNNLYVYLRRDNCSVDLADA